MKEIIKNGVKLIHDDYYQTDLEVREIQAKKGDFLRCTKKGNVVNDDFGTFTEGNDYEVVVGFNEQGSTISSPPGYDTADVLDDAGNLIRVNMNPDYPALTQLGLFELVE